MSNCDYILGRRCLLKSKFTGDSFATLRFCRENCEPNSTEKQRHMLKDVYGIEVNELPEPGTLQEEYQKEKKRGKAKKKKRRQELLAQLPGWFQLTRNLERHLEEIAVYYVKTGRIKVSEPVAAARLEVCRACPDDMMVVDDNGEMRCVLKSCGCYLDNPNSRNVLDGKAYYIALNCDNSHWQ